MDTSKVLSHLARNVFVNSINLIIMSKVHYVLCEMTAINSKNVFTLLDGWLVTTKFD